LLIYNRVAGAEMGSVTNRAGLLEETFATGRITGRRRLGCSLVSGAEIGQRAQHQHADEKLL
jgi:hypothetical protein